MDINKHKQIGELSPLELSNLYRQQKSLQKIGDMFGITRERVRQVMEQKGVPRTRRKILEERDMEIAKKYEDGYSIEQLIQIYQVSKMQVYRALCKYSSLWKNRFQTRNSQICSDYLKGMLIKEIAKKYNLSESHIRSILQKSGKRVIHRKNIAHKHIYMPAEQFKKLKLHSRKIEVPMSYDIR
ncbi:hypothetical protein J7M02_05615 [Candidatus Aerophobetes bacterium]|nr:hypothetical protein [Candidatus Aerophobetes bacterium]